ncbi:MAG TPA: hypothetical protein VIK93_05060, partial [Limnochordales bacterium]
SQNPAVRELIQHEINEVNRTLSSPEQVKKFAILPKRLYQEDGEVTPTLKVKRKAIMEKFADIVAQLYDERPPQPGGAAGAQAGAAETAGEAETAAGRSSSG